MQHYLDSVDDHLKRVENGDLPHTILIGHAAPRDKQDGHSVIQLHKVMSQAAAPWIKQKRARAARESYAHNGGRRKAVKQIQQ